YTNASPDNSGHGEGQTWLGSSVVPTDANGHASFTAILNALPAGQRFLSATATDAAGNTSEFCLDLLAVAPATLSGLVFKDFNNDGEVDFSEGGIPGVAVRLTGTDDLGHAIDLSQTTDADGLYAFTNLRPGNYYVTETQPAGYLQGINSIGTAGGS